MGQWLYLQVTLHLEVGHAPFTMQPYLSNINLINIIEDVVVFLAMFNYDDFVHIVCEAGIFLKRYNRKENSLDQTKLLEIQL